MRQVMARQLCTAGVVLLVMAILARFAGLDPATLMADNLAIIASATLIAVTAIFGWYVRRADRQSTHSRPRGNRPRSRTRHP